MSYVRTPFAVAGDRTSIPNTDPGDGTVNFQQGFPVRYSQDPETGGARIPRDKYNELMYIVTEAIQKYQQRGTPDFITAVENGGAAYPYAKYSRVLYDDGSGEKVYVSRIDNNTSLPSDLTDWWLEGLDYLQSSNNLSDLQSISSSRTNLDVYSKSQVDALINAGGVPIGMILPYPTASPPTGWLIANGSSYNTITYPGLVPLYPTGNLPDARGVVIRGWDNGRGVDPGRALLTEQLDAIQNITGFGGAFSMRFAAASGAFYLQNTEFLRSQGSEDPLYNLGFDASRVVRAASETRMRNLSYNFIIRAK